MEEVFLRQYSLSIGRAESLVKITIPALLIKPGGVESNPNSVGGATLADGSYQDFVTNPAKVLPITDLRITANILDSKAGSSNKNSSTIEIYNLTKGNQENVRSSSIVLLRAGYKIDGTELPLVYVGQIQTVTTTKRGQDTITKIVCRASEVGRKNVRISKVPVRGETSEDIAKYFAAVAAQNGIPTGNVFVPIPFDIPAGLPLIGNLFTLMEEFCRVNHLKCYVSLGRLYIEPENTITVEGAVKVVAPIFKAVEVQAENVKGSIRPQDDSSGKSSKDSKQGIELTLFLDGKISAAVTLKVKFGEFRGDYDITSVRFKMDSEGSAWDTIVSCTKRPG